MAHRWLALNSLDEAAARQMMRFKAHLGQRDTALAEFAITRQRLKQEMGLEPGLPWLWLRIFGPGRLHIHSLTRHRPRWRCAITVPQQTALIQQEQVDRNWRSYWPNRITTW